MRHIVYETSDVYKIAILVKDTAFNSKAIEANYINALELAGVDRKDIIVVEAKYNDKGKASASFIKEYLETLLPALESVGVKYLFCCDANYFKVLGKGVKSAEPNLGYVVPCGIKDYEYLDVILGINYRALIHNPNNEGKLVLSIETLANAFKGTYQGLGNDIIHHAEYPETIDEIKAALDKLHQYPELTADLETFSLRFDEAGIGSIAFAWSQHEGMAFTCDFLELAYESADNHWGARYNNPRVRALIKNFLKTYEGTLTWHNAAYDLKILIWELWMDHPKDYEGMLEGLLVLTNNWQDTKVITYLATNNTAENVLGLKAIAHSFAGNWAVDVEDIRLHKRAALLKYNLIDCLSTFWVKNENYPKMCADNQEDLYYSLMLPSLQVIIYMEMIGMPMYPTRLADVRDKLQKISDAEQTILDNSPIVKKLESFLAQKNWEKDFEDRKAKAKHPENIKPKDKSTFPKEKYNPNSGPQTQVLLYELMGLPVIEKTKGKQPAVGGKTLEKLINHTKNPEYIEVIKALQGKAKVSKILSSFIPAFESGIDKQDGRIWLHGSFNLGGTLSGRLSSSNP